MVVTDPRDFALITALYRSSVDGRRWMYEAILSDDNEYNIPDKFTSRTVQILQVYLKSLGIKMETILDDSEYVGEPTDDIEVAEYTVGNTSIMCTLDEQYYLRKLHKIYKRYLKENPNSIDEVDEVWAWIMDHLTFKKKYLTDNIIRLFKENINAFGEGSVD